MPRHRAIGDDWRVEEPAPQFFFGAMSPYSWLAAERIEQLLPQAQWRALFLGGMFKSNGRISWGLTDQRQQGIADCDERARSYGLGPINWPDPWPTSDLLVARAMTFADSRGLLKPFALSAMRLTFRDGRDIGELDAVLEAARGAGIDPAVLETAIAQPEVKQALREVNDEAQAKGVFGVPTTVLPDGQLFWGDDRLEEAVDAYRDIQASGA
jgi:2-hydroxychromene-2-carboxylate isomerase